MNNVWNRFMNPLEQRLPKLPDKRTGNNRFIKMKVIGLSAFSVFFSQCASFLEHQRVIHFTCESGKYFLISIIIKQLQIAFTLFIIILAAFYVETMRHGKVKPR